MVQVVLPAGTPVELYTATGVTPGEVLTVANTSQSPIKMGTSSDLASYEKLAGRETSSTLSGLSEVWVQSSFDTKIEVTPTVVLAGSSVTLGTQVSTTQDTVEAGIENGCVFYLFDEENDVSQNGGTFDILLSTGANTIRAKSRLVQSTSDNLSYEVYEGATVSANGTPLTLYNLNSVDPKTSTFTAFVSPTVTDTGDLIDLFPGYGSVGAGNRVTGFTSSGDGERILIPNTLYLLRFTNRSTTTDCDIYYRLTLCDREAT